MEKKRAQISICLECAVVFWVFFFWKIHKIIVVSSVQNRVPGEQKWRETFPYILF